MPLSSSLSFRINLCWVIDNLIFSRPERWESLPSKAGSMPGLHANLLTFMAGPRSCIGYRFALVESVFL
jgi:hypothetical protein